jgi:hypothetical protein
MNAIKLRVKYDSDPAAVTPEVQAALDKYVFYHNIELAPGIRTRGIPWTDLYVPPYLDVCRKFDFSGKRVLRGGNLFSGQLLFSRTGELYHSFPPFHHQSHRSESLRSREIRA